MLTITVLQLIDFLGRNLTMKLVHYLSFFTMIGSLLAAFVTAFLPNASAIVPLGLLSAVFIPAILCYLVTTFVEAR